MLMNMAIVVKDSAAAGNEALKPLFNAIVDGKLEPAVEVTKKAIAEGVQPVSYTHLDVYKRQTKTCRNYNRLPKSWVSRKQTL